MNIVKANTLLTPDRVTSLIHLVRQVEHVAGDIAQVGVYKGGSARAISLNTYKHIYLFDTFEGLPEPTKGKDWHKLGDFSDSSIAHVMKVMEPYANYTIVPGLFPSSSTFTDEKFSFVYIDVDLYQDTLNCFNYFYPRMNPGGIIVSDDYEMPSCPGVKLAIDEFMLDKPETLQSCARFQIHMVKQ